ncbi:MAG: CRISPR-associated endonuclease Cas1 [Candidatus Anstonellales archaeon]
MILICDEFGTWIGKKGERIILKKGGDVIKEVSMRKIEGIMVGKGVSLSSDFLVMLSKNNIPVFFSSDLSSPFIFSSSSLSLSNLRYAQSHISDDKKKTFVKNILFSKIFNQYSLALHLFGEELSYDDFYPSVEYESNFAKRYWSCVRKHIPMFVSRDRKSEDNVNLSLNYGYGILRISILKSVLASGLDPYFGMIHHLKDYSTSFVFDVMEPFRPIVDYAVFLCKDDLDKDFNSELKYIIAKKVLSVFKSNFFYKTKRTSLDRIFLLFCYEIGHFFRDEEKNDFATFRVFRWPRL